MGVSLARFGEFLEDFGKEVSWDILILQEFTGAKMVDGFMNKNTHRVILTAPVVGCRACGIVINHRICHCIILNSEIFRPRASSVCIHWEDGL